MLQGVSTLSFVIVAALVALAFFAGRGSDKRARRIRELEGALEETRAELAQREQAHQQYRKSVSESFSETSRRLHSLTIEYRSVYDHLATSAGELCPEGFEPLEQLERTAPAGLPEATAEAKPAAEVAAGETTPIETSPIETTAAAEPIPGARTKAQPR